MPKKFNLRALSETEFEKLTQLQRSRTAPKREVERAEIVLLFSAGQRVEAIAERVGRSQPTVYYQLQQFNERGIAFLQDLARVGRPLTYDENQRGQMVATARTKPQQLGLEFGHWTLDLLVTYVNETLDIAISRGQLAAILTQEGLKWYQEKTYFSDSPDPQFVEKRGQS